MDSTRLTLGRYFLFGMPHPPDPEDGKPGLHGCEGFIVSHESSPGTGLVSSWLPEYPCSVFVLNNWDEAKDGEEEESRTAAFCVSAVCKQRKAAVMTVASGVYHQVSSSRMWRCVLVCNVRPAVPGFKTVQC